MSTTIYMAVGCDYLLSAGLLDPRPVRWTRRRREDIRRLARWITAMGATEVLALARGDSNQVLDYLDALLAELHVEGVSTTRLHDENRRMRLRAWEIRMELHFFRETGKLLCAASLVDVTRWLNSRSFRQCVAGAKDMLQVNDPQVHVAQAAALRKSAARRVVLGSWQDVFPISAMQANSSSFGACMRLPDPDHMTLPDGMIRCA